VPNVSDPLGGAYYVEALTDKLERDAEELFAQIAEVGGVVAGARGPAGSSARSPRARRGTSGRSSRTVARSSG
jgi:methylmalonyl-CoA mutase N-terminal domain/subunit